jgi:hypothetical protein
LIFSAEPRLQYIIPIKEFSNYFIFSRQILSLDRSKKDINHRVLFSFVDHSGISRRQTGQLRGRFDEHEYDKKKFGMIELMR